MPIIFGLIEDGAIKGIIRTIGKQKIQSVDLSDFNEIDVSEEASLTNFIVQIDRQRPEGAPNSN